MVEMQPSHKFSDAAPSGYAVQVIRCPDNLSQWHLVNDYLKLRKEIFVDRLEWPLFHAEDLEFEQYDTFSTVYVIATLSGQVVGGARLRRTEQISGTGAVQYSYMSRDACIGILPGRPQDLCHEVPPLCDQTWEITRMVVTGPREVSRMILAKINDFLGEERAHTVLFLGSPAFRRMASTLSWPVKQLGPITGNKDGSFQVFQCPVQELRPQTVQHSKTNNSFMFDYK